MEYVLYALLGGGALAILAYMDWRFWEYDQQFDALWARTGGKITAACPANRAQKLSWTVHSPTEAVLHSATDILAVLRWPNRQWGGRQTPCRIETSDRQWLLNWQATQLQIRIAATNEMVAVYMGNGFGSGGELELLLEGRKIRLGCGVSLDYVFQDESGVWLAAINESRHEQVTIFPALSTYPELPILAFLGCYLVACEELGGGDID